MEKKIITEEQVQAALDKVLLEDVSKVSRYDFSRTQFKIEELQNSINETLKELRKLQEALPQGLKTVSNRRLTMISQYLIGAQGNTLKLKDVVRKYKKQVYAKQIEEKKQNS